MKMVLLRVFLVGFVTALFAKNDANTFSNADV